MATKLRPRCHRRIRCMHWLGSAPWSVHHGADIERDLPYVRFLNKGVTHRRRGARKQPNPPFGITVHTYSSVGPGFHVRVREVFKGGQYLLWSVQGNEVRGSERRGLTGITAHN